MPGKFTFYSTQIIDKIAFFDENEYRHAIISLRYKLHNEIEFTDGIGNYYSGEISEIGKKEFQANILKKKQINNRSNLQICIGIIKSTERMEWLVEKCTEIGIKSIYFMETKNAERSKINLPRMQKVALSALKQSHGSFLPDINTIAWNEALQFKAEKRCIANAEQIINIPWGQISKEKKSTVLLIGPEGDFTGAETTDALNAGYETVTLGNSILRTETAAVAACAVFAMGAGE